MNSIYPQEGTTKDNIANWSCPKKFRITMQADRSLVPIHARLRRLWRFVKECTEQHYNNWTLCWHLPQWRRDSKDAERVPRVDHCHPRFTLLLPFLPIKHELQTLPLPIKVTAVQSQFPSRSTSFRITWCTESLLLFLHRWTFFRLHVNSYSSDNSHEQLNGPAAKWCPAPAAWWTTWLPCCPTGGAH